MADPDGIMTREGAHAAPDAGAELTKVSFAERIAEGDLPELGELRALTDGYEWKYAHSVQVGNPSGHLYTETITTPEGIVGEMSIDSTGNVFTQIKQGNPALDNNIEIFRRNAKVQETHALFRQNYQDLRTLSGMEDASAAEFEEFLHSDKGRWLFKNYNAAIDGELDPEALHINMDGIMSPPAFEAGADPGFLSQIGAFFASPAGMAVIGVAAGAAIALIIMALRKKNTRIHYESQPMPKERKASRDEAYDYRPRMTAAPSQEAATPQAKAAVEEATVVSEQGKDKEKTAEAEQKDAGEMPKKESPSPSAQGEPVEEEEKKENEAEKSDGRIVEDTQEAASVAEEEIPSVQEESVEGPSSQPNLQNEEMTVEDAPVVDDAYETVQEPSDITEENMEERAEPASEAQEKVSKTPEPPVQEPEFFPSASFHDKGPDNFILDEANGAIVFKDTSGRADGLGARISRQDVERAFNAALASDGRFDSIIIDSSVAGVTADAFISVKEILREREANISFDNLLIRDGSRCAILSNGVCNHNPFIDIPAKACVVEKGFPLTEDGRALPMFAYSKELGTGHTGVLVLRDVHNVPAGIAANGSIGLVMTANSRDDFVTNFGEGAFKESTSLEKERDLRKESFHLLDDRYRRDRNAVDDSTIQGARKLFSYSRNLEIQDLRQGLTDRTRSEVEARLLKEAFENGVYQDYADRWIEAHRKEKEEFRRNDGGPDGLMSMMSGLRKVPRDDEYSIYTEEYTRRTEAEFERMNRERILDEFRRSEEFARTVEDRLSRSRNAAAEAERNAAINGNVDLIEQEKRRFGDRLEADARMIRRECASREMLMDVENIASSSFAKDAMLNTDVRFSEGHEWHEAMDAALEKEARLERYLMDSGVTEAQMGDIRVMASSPLSVKDIENGRYIPLSMHEDILAIHRGHEAVLDYITNRKVIDALRSHKALVTDFGTTHGDRAWMNTGLTGVIQGGGTKILDAKRDVARRKLEEDLKQKAEIEKAGRKPGRKLLARIEKGQKRLESLSRNPAPKLGRLVFGYDDLSISTLVHDGSQQEAYARNGRKGVLLKTEAGPGVALDAGGLASPTVRSYSFADRKEKLESSKDGRASFVDAFMKNYESISFAKAAFGIALAPFIGGILAYAALTEGRWNRSDNAEKRAMRDKVITSRIVSSSQKGTPMSIALDRNGFVDVQEIDPSKVPQKTLQKSQEALQTLVELDRDYNERRAKMATRGMGLEEFLKSHQTWSCVRRMPSTVLIYKDETHDADGRNKGDEGDQVMVRGLSGMDVPMDRKEALRVFGLKAKDLESGSVQTEFKGDKDFNWFAVRVDRNVELSFEDAQGRRIVANGNEEGRDEHGEGDWLVCPRRSDDRKDPGYKEMDFSRLQVVKGSQFAALYEMGVGRKNLSEDHGKEEERKSTRRKSSKGVER